MRAGRLTHKITIQQAVETINDFGGVDVSWETFREVWSRIIPLRGREYFESQQTNSDLSIKFEIYYLSGLTTKMRILDGTRIYDIESAVDVERRNRKIEMYCVERQ